MERALSNITPRLRAWTEGGRVALRWLSDMVETNFIAKALQPSNKKTDWHSQPNAVINKYENICFVAYCN